MEPPMNADKRRWFYWRSSAFIGGSNIWLYFDLDLLTPLEDEAFCLSQKLSDVAFPPRNSC